MEYLNVFLSPAFFRVVMKHEIVELVGAGAVLLVSPVGNHDVALEIGVGDFKKLYLLVVHLAPGNFGPEADADAASHRFLNSCRAVAFESDFGLESHLFAKFVADCSVLLGTIETDEFFFSKVEQGNGIHLLVFCGIGDGEENSFGTYE